MIHSATIPDTGDGTRTALLSSVHGRSTAIFVSSFQVSDRFEQTLSTLADRLDPPTADVHAPRGVTEAAVALVLRQHPQGPHPDVLLIRRATFPGDPWSGQVALPGGRADAADRNLRATAVRETQEEVGLDLERGRCLGRLPVVTPAHPGLPRVLVAPYLFTTGPEAEARPGPEVADLRWVVLPRLLTPARRLYRPPGRGDASGFPSIDLGDDFILWGLTLRIMDTFTARWRAARQAGGTDE